MKVAVLSGVVSMLFLGSLGCAGDTEAETVSFTQITLHGNDRPDVVVTRVKASHEAPTQQGTVTPGVGQLEQPLTLAAGCMPSTGFGLSGVGVCNTSGIQYKLCITGTGSVDLSTVTDPDTVTTWEAYFTANPPAWYPNSTSGSMSDANGANSQGWTGGSGCGGVYNPAAGLRYVTLM